MAADIITGNWQIGHHYNVYHECHTNLNRFRFDFYVKTYRTNTGQKNVEKQFH